MSEMNLRLAGGKNTHHGSNNCDGVSNEMLQAVKSVWEEYSGRPHLELTSGQRREQSET